MATWEPKPDITLSNGTVVHHRADTSNGVPNGATYAYVDGRAMTDAEWHEYCDVLKVLMLSKRGK